MSISKVVIVDENNFEREVLQSNLPVIVDFWADWCGPCKSVIPIINELSIEYEDKVKIAKLNVDENRNLATRYRVMSIPTVLFFNNGEEVRREAGAKTKSEYQNIINNFI